MQKQIYTSTHLKRHTLMCQYLEGLIFVHNFLPLVKRDIILLHFNFDLAEVWNTFVQPPLMLVFIFRF